jgi:hypothetical protein
MLVDIAIDFLLLALDKNQEKFRKISRQNRVQLTLLLNKGKQLLEKDKSIR